MSTFADARLRGRVGQATEPEDLKGKWFFEIEVWNIAGTEKAGDPIGPMGPFNTEKEAVTHMKRAIKLGAQAIVKHAYGAESDGYLDMKNGGVFRKWEES